jgi:predicted CoA-binding protein
LWKESGGNKMLGKRRAHDRNGTRARPVIKHPTEVTEEVQAADDAGDGDVRAQDTETTNWRDNVVETDAGLRELLAETHRVAVLGIKTEAQAFQPAFYVPQYMASAGFDVIPVPVYYPDATEIMGRKVYRKLADVPGRIDMVNVFRRSQDVPPHLEDILAARPKSVWFQSGIRNDRVAEQLARAGIKVVQDRCLMVEHRALGRRR